MAEQVAPNGEVIRGLPGRLATKLVRNGDMVHLRTCHRISGIEVIPWNWAEGKSHTEISSARANGLKFCRSCEPLLALLREGAEHG